MTAALAARNIDIVPGGDYFCRSFDPLGAFFRQQFWGSSAVPVITLQSTPHQKPALGSTYIAVFTSPTSCAWKLSYAPSDDAVLSVSADTLTATVTWVIPLNARKTSEYVEVTAQSFGGLARKSDIVHVGATSVRFIGPSDTYATLAAAKIGAAAGTRFVRRNGVSTSTNDFVDNAAGATATAIPNGVFTTFTDGAGNTRYTVTEFTTYMAETPLGVTLDGQGTNHTCRILGNHPWEQEFLDFDVSNSSSEFTSTPIETISRVGIAIKGFYFKDPAAEAVLVNWSRRIHVENCAAKVNVPSSYAFYIARSNDCLAENLFATGNMRGGFSYYRCLRYADRRILNVHQQNTCSEPIQGISIYENRYGASDNFIDIDSADAAEWWTGSGVTTASLGFPQSNFSTDGKSPDFSLLQTANGILSLNHNYGAVTAGNWEDADYSTNIIVRDVATAYNILPIEGYTLFDDGPMKIIGMQAARIRNTSTATGANYSNFISDYRCPFNFENLLFSEIGWNGTAAANQGCVFNGQSPVPNLINNYCVTETLGPTFSAVGTYTATNAQTTSNKKTDGWNYVERIELDSRFYTLNLGVAKSVLTVKGKKGTFYGDTGYDTYLNKDWTDTFPHEVITQILRDYSYTGSTLTKGTQTLSGNRGFAQVNTTLREYIAKTRINGSTVPVHYPYEFHIQAIDGDIYIFFRQYANAIREHRVYIDGIHCMTVPVAYHCAQIKPLRAGTYSIKLTCMDDNNVESGFSRAVSVTL